MTPSEEIRELWKEAVVLCREFTVYVVREKQVDTKDAFVAAMLLRNHGFPCIYDLQANKIVENDIVKYETRSVKSQMRDASKRAEYAYLLPQNILRDLRNGRERTATLTELLNEWYWLESGFEDDGTIPRTNGLKAPPRLAL